MDVIPAIEVSGVRKVFGRTVALDRVDLAVAPGTFLGLIGHNGAGKSTLLELLFGRLIPTEGTVRVGGVEVGADPAAARRIVGGVPEELALYEWLSAREWFELVAEVRGTGDVASALDVCDLGADAERPIREYSQGMRRRTALAAALLGDPPVVLLDEALNGLDPPSAARIKGILRSVVDSGRTVVLSTHVVETVERVADRVVMLAHGRIVADELTSALGQEGLERLFLERLAASKG
ncbi:MAG: ABC transporter ATP-binding protein [Deltaproteobacteria bacterium]|nr:ABC transporter ATP-binding protein [Deltaproteobacteria bacterium]